jgi:transposase-like protein
MSDQDTGEAKAIKTVFSDAKHMLCTWHLTNNLKGNWKNAFKLENGKQVRKHTAV